jgi:hypothetical protein
VTKLSRSLARSLATVQRRRGGETSRVAKLSKHEETKIKSAAKLKNTDGESSDKEDRREKDTKLASLPRSI